MLSREHTSAPFESVPNLACCISAFTPHLRCPLAAPHPLPLPPAAVQVINKYGDLYGAERIAELLGLDKSALDFDPTVETVEKEASLVSW